MKTTLERTCQFSPCRKYRYTLWRSWPIEDALFGECSKETAAHHYLMVIGLNPSTADETKDDPTIRKCIGFAKRWGFGALCMTNLFAWRDTDPDKMKLADDPVGAMNDTYLRKCALGAGMVLAAWGTHGSHLGRASEIQKMLWCGLKCLGKNKDGSPKHPLYVPYEMMPIAL